MKDLRRVSADDPHRPGYHFLPPANWLNDPNGLIQWRGQYHLFYQYNPNGPFHGSIHWGHAVSGDLVHWSDLPIALAPTPDGPDVAGCYSGCAVDNDGVPTLVYTGIQPEVQCIATSDDDLRTWRKHPANPVIAAPPPGMEVLGFRDPWVWRDGDRWFMAVGSGLKDVGGTILLYESSDLVHWTFSNTLCTGRQDETGTMWECPNFFPLGDKHVLVLSPIPLRKAIYLIGTYANRQFVPESSGDVDLGGCFYAPQTMLDERGRRLMWGWLWENRGADASRAAGWNGVMSLPRVLTLRPDRTIGVEPAPELELLRGQSRHWGESDLNPTGAIDPKSGSQLLDVHGDSFELRAEIALGDATELGIDVRRSPDGAERTRVIYDHAAGELRIDRTQSSADPDTIRDMCACPLRLAAGETLRLRVFVDRSVVEVFANERVALASRIYPTRPDSLGVAWFIQGGPAHVRALDIWEIGLIWDGEARAIPTLSDGGAQ